MPLDEIYLENQFVTDAGPGASPEAIAQAQCFARTLIDDPSVAPLIYVDELTTDQQAVVDWVTTTAAQICGAPQA